MVSNREVSVGHHRLLLGIVLTATAMQLLDTAIVNVALPSIQVDLHAPEGLLILVSSAYTLAYGCSLITGAALGARFGYRRLFLIGMGLFTVSSALCSAAPNAALLVLFRFCQGLGSGCMAPQTLSVIQTVFQGRARARAMSTFGVVVGVASVFGPVAGGLILGVDAFGLGWRMIFLVNVPVGLAALIAAWRFLRVPPPNARQRFDIAGALLVTAAVLLLVVPLAVGRQEGWPLWIVVALAFSPAVFAVAVFQQLRRQRRGGQPLLHLRLLRVRSLRIGLLLVMGFFSAIASYFFIQPLYIQTGLGHTPLAAGLVGIPFSLTCALGARAVPRLSMRFGRSLLTVGALAMVVTDAILFVVAGSGDPALWEIAVPLGAGGLGYGVFFASCYGLAVSDVPTGSASTASGLLPTVQQVAGSIGIAVVGLVFFAAVGVGAPAGALTSTHGVRSGYAAAFRHGLLVEMALLLATALVSLRLPRRAAAPLGGTSDEARLEAGLPAA